MKWRMGRVLACGLLPLGACIPYAVGQTALPLAPGETTYTQSTFVIPHGAELSSDSGRRYVPRVGSDVEWRHGLEGEMDVGVRVASGTGLIVNVKRRHSLEERSYVTSHTLGAGFVNGGQHAYGEFLLHVSASERLPRTVTPYAAMRLSQVLPMSRDAVSDTPTIGFTVGARIGDSEFAIVPEVGVFYDRSALGINSRPIIFVPSVSITRRQSRSNRE